MRVKFPRHLNAPLQIIFFEADDIGVFMILLFIAMTFKHWILYVLMILGTWQYRRIKSKYPRGFLLHVLYFWGLVDLSRYPSAFENVFIE